MTVDAEYAFDPSDPATAKNPEFMGRIRRERGVVRPSEGLVVSTRYAATAKAFRDNKNFSSAGDMRAPGVTVPEEESFLGELDPPVHPKIRRILLRSFTPRTAAAAEEWTRQNVRRRLDALDARGGGDLMDDLAVPLPGSVSAHVLGVPDELHDQMMTWCNEVLHSTWVPTGRTELGVGVEKSFPDLSAALDRLIEERRSAPTEDLLGTMVNTVTDDDWRISEEHVRTLTINILAGSLSASYMLGNLMYRYLADEDGFAQRLSADPSLIPAAVLESLRLEAPVQFMFRHATKETEVGECPVHKGEMVLLSIAAANRDESVYPDPDSFRLDRVDPPESLAFGLGPHLCLGNHLTLMAGKVVLEEIVGRYPPSRLRLPEDFEWVGVDHMLEFGPEHLPVTVQG
jgi:cytochrome P450